MLIFVFCDHFNSSAASRNNEYIPHFFLERLAVFVCLCTHSSDGYFPCFLILLLFCSCCLCCCLCFGPPLTSVTWWDDGFGGIGCGAQKGLCGPSGRRAC